MPSAPVPPANRIFPAFGPDRDRRGSVAGAGDLHRRAIHNRVRGGIVKFGRGPRDAVAVVAAREQDLAGIWTTDQHGCGFHGAPLHLGRGNFGRKPVRRRIVQIGAVIDGVFAAAPSGESGFVPTWNDAAGAHAGCAAKATASAHAIGIATVRSTAASSAHCSLAVFELSPFELALFRENARQSRLPRRHGPYRHCCWNRCDRNFSFASRLSVILSSRDLGRSV